MSFKTSEGAQWSEPKDSGAAVDIRSAVLALDADGSYTLATTGEADGKLADDVEGSLVIRPASYPLASARALKVGEPYQFFRTSSQVAAPGAETFDRTSSASYVEDVTEAAPGAETFSRTSSASYIEDV